MTNKNIVPDASAQLLKGGLVSDTWFGFFRRVGRGLQALQDGQDALQTGKAASTQTWRFPVHITTPVNKSYTYLQAGWNGTIDQVVTQSTAGTCTVTVSVQGLAIGGSANAASSTLQTTEHTADNAIYDGNTISITVSSNSSCANLSVTLIGTREMD